MTSPVRCAADGCGRSAAAAVPFALDGRAYEIDLCGPHAEQLHRDLEVFLRPARRVAGPSRSRARVPAEPPGREDVTAGPERRGASEDRRTRRASAGRRRADGDRSEAGQQDDERIRLTVERLRAAGEAAALRRRQHGHLAGDETAGQAAGGATAHGAAAADEQPPEAAAGADIGGQVYTAHCGDIGHQGDSGDTGRRGDSGEAGRRGGTRHRGRVEHGGDTGASDGSDSGPAAGEAQDLPGRVRYSAGAAVEESAPAGPAGESVPVLRRVRAVTDLLLQAVRRAVPDAETDD